MYSIKPRRLILEADERYRCGKGSMNHVLGGNLSHIRPCWHVALDPIAAIVGFILLSPAMPAVILPIHLSSRGQV